jgi:hypothetical protein
MTLTEAKKVIAEALATFRGTLQDHQTIQTAFKELLDNTKPEVHEEVAPLRPSSPSVTLPNEATEN